MMTEYMQPTCQRLAQELTVALTSYLFRSSSMWLNLILIDILTKALRSFLLGSLPYLKLPCQEKSYLSHGRQVRYNSL